MIEHLKGREQALDGAMDGPDAKRNGLLLSVSIAAFSRGRSILLLL